MSMRIAVTGKEGQVVRSMRELGPVMDVEVIAVGRPELDLMDPDTVLRALKAAKPDAIVSAAAYTAVDRAEADCEVAFAVNGKGAEAVAKAARMLRVPLLHLSTDYVFDGTKIGRYVETDLTAPASVYGASKLMGERLVAATMDDYAIFRTAWVYSHHGQNFLRTMLRLGQNHSTLAIVADQRGCPTSAIDIGRAMILAARKLVVSNDNNLRGLFHLTGSGEATWADFAREIFSAAEAHGRQPVVIDAITSDQHASIAKRPRNSRLSTEKLLKSYGIALPDWQHSAKDVVNILLSQPTEKNYA
jgi:dTDP-4-dehydrorhamnose reductase